LFLCVHSLICTGGAIVRCHRLALAALSAPLRNILRQQPTTYVPGYEEQPSVVFISLPDADAGELRAFLEGIYLGGEQVAEVPLSLAYLGIGTEPLCDAAIGASDCDGSGTGAVKNVTAGVEPLRDTNKANVTDFTQVKEGAKVQATQVVLTEKAPAHVKKDDTVLTSKTIKRGRKVRRKEVVKNPFKLEALISYFESADAGGINKNTFRSALNYCIDSKGLFLKCYKLQVSDMRNSS